ncbi:MAG: hypothetical protein ABJA74_09995 [Lapillicoccus sp.]
MSSIAPSAPPALPQVLQEYYRILTSGAAAYGHGDVLRPLLANHLEFTGSLAGHRVDATEGFLQGVSGFISTVQRIDFLQEVHDDHGSAVLYDATMPGGTVRFAEFFTFRDGVINTLFLHYDGPDYINKGGR